MVELGELSISSVRDRRGLSSHQRCPRMGMPPLRDPAVGPMCQGQEGDGRYLPCHRSRRCPLLSLLSQDSLISQQTVLTHMCEELI